MRGSGASERQKLALTTFDWCAVCGTPFADELRWQMVFEVQGFGPYRGKSYPVVAGLMLTGTEQEIREFSDGSGDEAFSAVGP